MTAISLINITLELAGSLVCLSFIFFSLIGRSILKKSGIYMVALLSADTLLLVFDAMAYIFRGNTTEFGFFMTKMSNSLVYILQFGLLFLAAVYIHTVLTESLAPTSGLFVKLTFVICAIGVLVTLFSQFTHILYYFDEQNFYHRSSGIYLTMGLAFTGILLTNGAVVIYRRCLSRSQFITLMSYLFLPLFATMLQALVYGCSFMNLGITASLWCMFAAQETARVHRIEQQSLLLAIQKEKLTEQRIRLITSQIQPHFLYNALATISSLCQIDPGMAERAVDHFADYLRMNLDTLSNDRLIEFNKELEHTKTYLWLEQLRFGSDLRIEYDIRFTDFALPPLVLQPLAENAVKHGICKREEGGTVHISCCRVDGNVEITVRDDGVGFEVGRSFTDERSHIGISNVRERLEKLCSGTVRVTSDPGHGTCAIITIPGGFIHEDPIG